MTRGDLFIDSNLLNLDAGERKRAQLEIYDVNPEIGNVKTMTLAYLRIANYLLHYHSLVIRTGFFDDKMFTVRGQNGKFSTNNAFALISSPIAMKSDVFDYYDPREHDEFGVYYALENAHFTYPDRLRDERNDLKMDFYTTMDELLLHSMTITIPTYSSHIIYVSEEGDPGQYNFQINGASKPASGHFFLPNNVYNFITDASMIIVDDENDQLRKCLTNEGLVRDVSLPQSISVNFELNEIINWFRTNSIQAEFYHSNDAQGIYEKYKNGFPDLSQKVYSENVGLWVIWDYSTFDLNIDEKFEKMDRGNGGNVLGENAGRGYWEVSPNSRQAVLDYNNEFDAGFDEWQNSEHEIQLQKYNDLHGAHINLEAAYNAWSNARVEYPTSDSFAAAFKILFDELVTDNTLKGNVDTFYQDPNHAEKLFQVLGNSSIGNVLSVVGGPLGISTREDLVTYLYFRDNPPPPNPPEFEQFVRVELNIEFGKPVYPKTKPEINIDGYREFRENYLLLPKFKLPPPPDLTEPAKNEDMAATAIEIIDEDDYANRTAIFKIMDAMTQYKNLFKNAIRPIRDAINTVADPNTEEGELQISTGYVAFKMTVTSNSDDVDDFSYALEENGIKNLVGVTIPPFIKPNIPNFYVNGKPNLILGGGIKQKYRLFFPPGKFENSTLKLQFDSTPIDFNFFADGYREIELKIIYGDTEKFIPLQLKSNETITSISMLPRWLKETAKGGLTRELTRIPKGVSMKVEALFTDRFFKDGEMKSEGKIQSSSVGGFHVSLLTDKVEFHSLNLQSLYYIRPVKDIQATINNLQFRFFNGVDQEYPILSHDDLVMKVEFESVA